MPQADPLPANELAIMLRALESPRDRFLLVLLLGTGLRISEALSLRIAHIADPDLRIRDCIVVPRNFVKGKIAARTCWLIPDIRHVAAAYISWLETRDLNQVLFPSRKGENLCVTPRHAARLLLPAFQAAAKRGHYTTHSPRKWFARKMHAAMGRDLYATQAALGHRSPMSTTYYLSSTQQRIRRAINKALPEVFSGVTSLFPQSESEEET
jgi:integrase